ncbi:hypothetical protein Q5P01_018519 [Channa striata]|uniref:Uncharacterized protein n=1 Tax=Channa striata TaxID=64152 RepID=A0AA88SE68_CHASR|nr:hypothetical protein Q5P01_018519 [Channa striata]
MSSERSHCSPNYPVLFTCKPGSAGVSLVIRVRHVANAVVPVYALWPREGIIGQCHRDAHVSYNERKRTDEMLPPVKDRFQSHQPSFLVSVHREENPLLHSKSP